MGAGRSGFTPCVAHGLRCGLPAASCCILDLRARSEMLRHVRYKSPKAKLRADTAVVITINHSSESRC